MQWTPRRASAILNAHREGSWLDVEKHLDTELKMCRFDVDHMQLRQSYATAAGQTPVKYELE